MNLSIVIPNYNGAELLVKNLPKAIEEFKNYHKGNVEIIMVDDASTDGSVGHILNLELKTSNLKLIRNGENLGFSSTVNKGVKEAKGEIIILLNTDVVPEKGFLNPLLAHFVDQQVFAVGCMDKSIEGDKIIERGRGLGEWKRGFLIHRRGEVNKANTLWVSGGSGAFRKSIWDKLGGMCELYNPFYWEDIDLGYRALKAGYKLVFESKSVVIHKHAQGSIRQKFSFAAIQTIAYRNQFIFVWKNIADTDLILNHMVWLPYQCLQALLRGDNNFLKGFLNALILLPKILSLKIKEKKLWTLTDKQVLDSFL